MKPSKREIALERMKILVQTAISNARSDPELSQKQAQIARRISTKHKVRMPYELKLAFCKKCKLFIAPGINSKIRMGRTSIKSVRISCNFCGHTYRKIIPKTSSSTKV